jgi:hypothetical protein
LLLASRQVIPIRWFAGDATVERSTSAAPLDARNAGATSVCARP